MMVSSVHFPRKTSSQTPREKSRDTRALVRSIGVEGELLHGTQPCPNQAAQQRKPSHLLTSNGIKCQQPEEQQLNSLQVLSLKIAEYDMSLRRKLSARPRLCGNIRIAKFFKDDNNGFSFPLSCCSYERKEPNRQQKTVHYRQPTKKKLSLK